MTLEFLKTIAVVMGVILSIPFLLALIKLTLFIGRMESTVAATANSLKVFMEHVENNLDKHSDQLKDHSVKLGILMDGYERRTGQDRRKSDKLD